MMIKVKKWFEDYSHIQLMEIFLSKKFHIQVPLGHPVVLGFNRQ